MDAQKATLFQLADGNFMAAGVNSLFVIDGHPWG